MSEYTNKKELLEILDNKYLLPFRQEERLRGLASIDIIFCGECKRASTKQCPLYAMGLGYTDKDFCSYGKRGE